MASRPTHPWNNAASMTANLPPQSFFAAQQFLTASRSRGRPATLRTVNLDGRAMPTA